MSFLLMGHITENDKCKEMQNHFRNIFYISYNNVLAD